MAGKHHMAVFQRQGDVLADAGPLFHAWQRSGCTQVAVSVLEGYPDLPLALFLSGAERLPEGGWRLVPLIGFCEDPGTCNQLRLLGAPALEAQLTVDLTDEGLVSVEVHLPFWTITPGALEVSKQPMLALRLPQQQADDTQAPQVPVSFELRNASPDPVEPGSVLSVVSRYYEAGWVSPLEASLPATLSLQPARCPDLQALLGAVPSLVGQSAWYTSQAAAEGTSKEAYPLGQALLPLEAHSKDMRKLFDHPRINEVSPLGHGHFIFDGVELIGFRFQVNDRSDLSVLLEALNGTGMQVAGPSDFQYEAATATVVIELLRYRRMRVADAQPPLSDQHYTRQHELLVRLLVGRVDDDTAQARDPAAFMPVLYVDDVWSKWLGRELEGFPKELAQFMVGKTVLQADGRVPDGDVKQLHEVDQVRTWDANALLRLEYPGVQFDDDFDQVDIGLLGGTALGGLSRWRQDDLDDKAFSRNFARDVMVGSQASFDTVQSTPVDGRFCEARALIQGRASLSNVRIQYPTGLAVLSFFKDPHAPNAPSVQQQRQATSPPSSGQGWNQLIELLQKKRTSDMAQPPPGAADTPQTPDVVVRCVTGEFYRAHFDMQLQVLPSL